MSPAMIEFCEQTNPKVLGDIRRAAFQKANRIQQSLVATLEKRVLLWLAERMPAGIHPDHLTTLGFLSQLMAGLSYAMSRKHQAWLVVCIGFLALNWFGDSLDGTLARYRGRQRPRYGFYVDHIVDSIGALALITGLAASGYMTPWIAFGLLIAFLLLSIQSYLATYTLGEFRLSFWSFGPTELRLLLALGNLVLLRWPVVLKGHYRLFDVGGVFGLIGMASMFLFFTARNIRRLYREEKIV